MAKPETYKGIEIVFRKADGMVIAGFPKRPDVASGRTREEALAKVREVMDGFPSVVTRTYMKYPKVMKELEEM